MKPVDSNRMRIVYFFFISLVISSCRPASPREQITPTIISHTSENIATSDLKPTAVIVPTFTNLPVITASTTIEPSATPLQVDHQFPQIALGMGTNFFQCLREINNEILLSDLIDRNEQQVLSDPGNDLNFPSWSSDGIQIAYVKSQPNRITSIDEYPAKTGADSIWLYTLADGKHQQISDLVPSSLFAPPDSCMPITYISQPPAWSPEGRYLSFQQVDLVSEMTNYYLINLDIPMTTKIYAQKRNSPLNWLSDNLVAVVNDQNDIALMTIGRSDTVDSEVILKSDSFPSNSIQHILPDPQISDLTESLTVEVVELDENHARKIDQIWSLNLNSHDWTSIAELPAGLTGRPVLAKNWMALCTEQDTITVFERKTWQPLWSTDPNTHIFCNSIQYIENDAGDELFSFIGFQKKQPSEKPDDYGIWVIDPLTMDLVSVYSVDQSDPVPDQNDTILSYMWEPSYP